MKTNAQWAKYLAQQSIDLEVEILIRLRTIRSAHPTTFNARPDYQRLRRLFLKAHARSNRRFRNT